VALGRGLHSIVVEECMSIICGAERRRLMYVAWQKQPAKRSSSYTPAAAAAAADGLV